MGMMPAEAQVFLCTPAPLFDSNGWLSRELLSTQIVPRVRSIAAKRGLRLVELFESSLAQHPEFFPDGLHPNVSGAREIAALVGRVLLENGEESDDETSRADH